MYYSCGPSIWKVICAGITRNVAMNPPLFHVVCGERINVHMIIAVSVINSSHL